MESIEPAPPRLRTVALFHQGELGGPSVSLFRPLEALASVGTVCVGVPTDGTVAERFRAVGDVTILDYEPLTVPRTLRSGIDRAASLRAEVRRLRGYLRRERPDLVIVSATVLLPALFAAWLERKPTISLAGELMATSENIALQRVRSRALFRAVEQLADAVVCCSDAVAGQFEGRARAEIVTIHPGIEEAPKSDPKPTDSKPPMSPILLCVGDISPGRGQDVLIRALPAVRRRFPQATCVFVGSPHPRDGDRRYLAEITALAARLRLTDAVIFTGSSTTIGDWLARADCVINPVRVPEAFGRVALEALLAGRPVIASRIGAIPDVLRDGEDALLIDPNDPDGMADAVITILSDPELRLAMVGTGRTRVLREFSQQNNTSAFLRVVLGVAGTASADTGNSR